MTAMPVDLFRPELTRLIRSGHRGTGILVHERLPTVLAKRLRQERRSLGAHGHDRCADCGGGKTKTNFYEVATFHDNFLLMHLV
jgi:hypothetical protein